MGLRIGKATWSYSGFNNFRARLARKIEINLDQMIGFGGATKWPRKDIIEHLLNHSDCDGIITPNVCIKLAPRLKELINDWDDKDYDKIMGLRLAKEMEKAAITNKNLEFH